ncbi:hypothetical protein HDU99_003679 [Rhizoclosmatium hyalinum]|nr:hypothetical protein HDU99_003679 [Rhizoclosmatium hyalinum]
MTSIRRDQIMKLQPPAPAMEVPGPGVEQKENDDGDKLDPDKFGSKIRELVEYLQREMAEDENNRFLVFIQWSDLADLVSQALNTFGIATARLKSGFTQREAALKQFRAGLPEGSFVKVKEAEADDEDESKVENDETKREIKQETVNTNSVETELIPLKKDVKGKGRAVPLDLESEDVQQLPPVMAVRKKRPATVFVSDSDDSEPEVGMTEEKNETHLATTSTARPGKKPRTKVNISEDDLSTVKLDPNAPNDEFEESSLDVKTVKKKRVTAKEVESKSMKRERKYKAVKVLMLSAKDSVSGLNLTEATHCIIMHPFHDNKEEYAIGAEKQGVARTLRNGQTKTVKIVRFVVERTVEQEMHDRRVDKLKD